MCENLYDDLNRMHDMAKDAQQSIQFYKDDFSEETHNAMKKDFNKILVALEDFIFAYNPRVRRING